MKHLGMFVGTSVVLGLMALALAPGTALAADGGAPPKAAPAPPPVEQVHAVAESCGWVSCTHHFSRRATKDIANLPVLAGPVCAATAFVHPSVGAGCAIYAGAIIYQATRAKDRPGHCLKIKYPRFWSPPAPVVLVPQIERCR